MFGIDSIILGDNQFFGVNHMSQDKGRLTYEKFKDMTEIKNILYCAMDNGVKGVMFSTHPEIYNITGMIRNDPALKYNFSIYINVPYIVKYVSMVTEMGIYRTIRTMFKGKSFINNVKYLYTSAYNVLTNDFLGITNRLIDVELNPFSGLNVKSVFLHNTLCDLALGYNLVSVIKNFHEYIEKKYKIIPAYGTLNYPLFCKFLNNAHITNALVMTAVNKKGFLMNPSRAACEEAIHTYSHEVLAMATLASGSLHPEEAYEYLFSIGNIKHIVVGLSSKKHADETFKIINKYIN
jgi:hypothetical protein